MNINLKRGVIRKKMPLLLKAKTNDGYIVKILAELLQNNVRLACLCITERGINIRTMDSNRYILIDVDLKSSNFNIFEVASDIKVGINLRHFYKLVKSIKKRDMVQLSIDEKTPDDLTITIFPKDSNSVITSSVRNQTIQQITPKIPDGYISPIIITSSEYQRTIKTMKDLPNDTVSVIMKKHSLIISCSTQGICSRDVLFGELNDDTDEVFRDTFSVDFFTRIIKVTGLNSSLQFYGGNKERPLKIETLVGNLGTISIFIKSQEQIRCDNKP